MFSFVINLEYYLIPLKISSLTHLVFRSVLLHLYVFWDFPVVFLLLISTLISLLSEQLLHNFFSLKFHKVCFMPHKVVYLFFYVTSLPVFREIDKPRKLNIRNIRSCPGPLARVKGPEIGSARTCHSKAELKPHWMTARRQRWEIL